MLRLALVVLILQTALQSGRPPASQDEIPGMALIPAGDFWMGRNHSFLFDELNWTLRPRLCSDSVAQSPQTVLKNPTSSRKAWLC